MWLLYVGLALMVCALAILMYVTYESNKAFDNEMEKSIEPSYGTEKSTEKSARGVDAARAGD